MRDGDLIENGNGNRSTIKIGTEVENECGVGMRVRSVTGTGHESGTGSRLTSTDIKDERIHSMSMLTELQISTVWTSHPRKRTTTCDGPTSLLHFCALTSNMPCNNC
ncbi:hypothetical protein EVAR_59633_1 [Eumeta japonica]|uniref:Uncharacterized protein n=1 Tax=Eumeta variegata TaxID=151549 RepID=A0A4C1YFA7_EUMVA|nr:hypothetical protein EVAR_59633_1 [Eumeta japonica]